MQSFLLTEVITTLIPLSPHIMGLFLALPRKSRMASLCRKKLTARKDCAKNRIIACINSDFLQVLVLGRAWESSL